MNGDSREAVALHVQFALYATGFLGNGAAKMMSLIVPLWAISLEPSPFLIGVILGSRSFLPMLLSIHSGSLMDRWGARRLIIAFAALGLMLTPLFPLMPWIGALIALQMLAGFAETTIWTGAQTFVGQMGRGDTRITGRLVFGSRIGQLSGPPIAGLAWDFAGPWGAFGVIALWAAALLGAAWMLPEKQTPTAGRHQPTSFTLRDLIPRFSDYRDAFKLLAAPAIALLIGLSMLNLSVGAVHGSFYVIYVQGIGYSATLIGILVSTASILAAAGTLAAAPLTRTFSEVWVLHLTTAMPIVFMGLTPFLGTYSLLLVAIAFLGFAQGINQPLIISVISRVTGRQDQGKAVGLRATNNRITTTFIPIAMGGIVEIIGLGLSFPVICGTLVAIQALLLFLNGRLRREGQLR
jgi:MFS family permease